MIRATYRLQFHKDFTFADAAAQADYFAALGISHIYTSPILTARAGSLHGYDVVDHGHINPELGGESGFRAMAAALQAQGLGLIVDIVPNHVAVGRADNRWWLDLLAKGPQSRFADAFDIDWDTPGLEGKVLAPFLDGTPDALLAKGELKLVQEISGWAFAYYDHRFPLRPEDQPVASSIPLPALLARQNFVLADWREANDRINWRRFFDITDLAAIRIAEPSVFEAVHEKIFALFAEGLIDGVRVDHIDGLADPAGYCRTLRGRLTALGRKPYIIVEKILAGDEDLPPQWECDGTTGYEVMNDLAALLHDGAAAPALDALWHRHGARGRSFEEEEREARRFILRTRFAAQHAAMARAFAKTLAMPQAEVAGALAEILVRLRCYRSYATGRPGTPGPGPHLARALADTIREANNSLLEPIAVLFARDDDDPAVVDALRRFHQLSAPLAAKAVEDTAFYRYGRILSRNDVGSDPRQTGLSVEAFHRRVAARAAKYPRSMLTTATHDSKRGEDARARIAALTQNMTAWETFVDSVTDRPSDLDAGDVYQLLQTIVGFWENPFDAEQAAKRLEAWGRKFLREAKLRSGWDAPDNDYESAFCGFARALVAAPEQESFRKSLAIFLRAIETPAAANSLAQTVLRYTLPGTPDLYQGTEYADHSLVDPDNRRPVDLSTRAASLRGVSELKQHAIHLLLRQRAENPDLWMSGGYEPIVFEDVGMLAFERQWKGSRALVLIHLRGEATGHYRLSSHHKEIFTGKSFAPGIFPLAELLGVRGAAVFV